MLVKCNVEELKRAFAIGNKMSETSSVIRSGNEIALISPCQEGALVQKIDVDETTPGAQLELSPEILERSATFLGLLNGTAVMDTENGRLVLRVEEVPGTECSFVDGFTPMSPIEDSQWKEDLGLEVSGTALKELFRRTLPRAVLPETDCGQRLENAFAILRSDEGQIEVVGTNSVVTTWGTVNADAHGNLSPLVLPRSLILRALEIDDVWEDTVAIGMDGQGFLGNRHSYLVWPLVDPPFEPQSIFDAAKDLWRGEARLHGWVKPEALSAIAKAFAEAGRPGAARVSWNTESIAVFPLYREISVTDAFGRRSTVPSEKPEKSPGGIFLRGVKPIVHRPGSLVVPTVGLELAAGLLERQESQLLVSEHI